MRSKAEAIEQYLLKIISLSEDDMVELRRADLSCRFSCVPSQINYVLNTRFTMQRGYVVESRRGGGGYLRIVKLPIEKEHDFIRRLTDPDVTKISVQESINLVYRLVEEGFLTKSEARMILSVTGSSFLARAHEEKDALRMDLLREMILTKVREK